MPPVVFWMIGAVGAFAAIKWIARETDRINAELHPEAKGEPKPVRVKLRRDQAGVYRPE
ncbi:hypothetical protein GJW-30_1_01589 [Variibacter gotjawalensis]|uniref:Uncharacterized protein n=1 Tax=Variibacter gotjawalensis TaxID=1333996 RepID=A0A0S3PT48_9BRAD|nr:hypothetical protein [Variibacter gotjawalensis]NIK49375.1 hypothetical protein [Variibacter gotjawalensis]RZS51226.1 hypothetical protein EV661_3703 [Variibacter gotjawalensis]BAT59060.1 hypothetical protein GJW-30_1_01589 [Variibacter gotjawalensis]